MLEESLPETQQPLDSELQEWELNPTAERANLKECADLMESVLRSVVSDDQPARIIAGYAEDFLRRHGGELPSSVIKEINDNRMKLLEPGAAADSTQQ